MLFDNSDRYTGGVFITFSGNCREALTFYQTCFGGALHLDMFDQKVEGYGVPVVSGSLVSDRIVIHGSDLVHNEGRRVGNYLSIFVPCADVGTRRLLMGRLAPLGRDRRYESREEQKLIEVVDAFDVRWVLAI
jgi:PhnB protein